MSTAYDAVLPSFGTKELVRSALRAFEMTASLDSHGYLEFRTDGYAVTLLDNQTTLEISERNGRIVRAVLSGQPKEQ